MLITLFSLTYPLFVSNRGYSLSFRHKIPISRYIIQILPPLDAKTQKEVLLAFIQDKISDSQQQQQQFHQQMLLEKEKEKKEQTPPTPLPTFTLSNHKPSGQAISPSPQNNSKTSQSTTLTRSQSNLNNNNNNNNKYSQKQNQSDDVMNMSYNAYIREYNLQEARKNINSNALSLLQSLDAIRSSMYITDNNLSLLPYTISLSTISALDTILTNLKPSPVGAKEDKNQTDATVVLLSNKNKKGNHHDLNKDDIPQITSPSSNTSGLPSSLTTQTDNTDPNSLKGLIKKLKDKGPEPSTISSLRSFGSNLKYYLQSPHQTCGEKVEVKLYYPFIFKAIRESHHIVSSEFIDSWSYSLSQLPKSSLGAGRSGAQFMRSKCNKFIYKSMSQADMNTLHDLIADYGEYITTNSSMLMRIFGIYRIVGKDGKKLYFLVAANAFYLPDYLSQHYSLSSRYDLKGRKPKLAAEDRRVEADAGVFKDLQLSRVFVLHESTRDQIIANIVSDCQWLKEHDCIDYSLLVGVCENANFALDLDEAGRFTNVTAPSFVPNVPINVQHHRQVGTPPYVKAQDDHAEIFLIAIVDFLARFNNMAKRGANAFKSIRWSQDELSTVDSEFYSERFNQYAKVVFPPNNSILVRTKNDIREYFTLEARLKLSRTFSPHSGNNSNTDHHSDNNSFSPNNNPQDEAEVQKLVDLSIKALPPTAISALEPDARSPGSLIVTSSGKHIVILPKGVNTAPKSLVERSKIELSTKHGGIQSALLAPDV
jgi:hypothetical protein